MASEDDPQTMSSAISTARIIIPTDRANMLAKREQAVRFVLQGAWVRKFPRSGHGRPRTLYMRFVAQAGSAPVVEWHGQRATVQYIDHRLFDEDGFMGDTYFDTHKADESLCFSLKLAHRRLYLLTHSEIEKERWVDGVNELIRAWDRETDLVADICTEVSTRQAIAVAESTPRTARLSRVPLVRQLRSRSASSNASDSSPRSIYPVASNGSAALPRRLRRPWLSASRSLRASTVRAHVIKPSNIGHDAGCPAPCCVPPTGMPFSARAETTGWI